LRAEDMDKDRDLGSEDKDENKDTALSSRMRTNPRGHITSVDEVS